MGQAGAVVTNNVTPGRRPKQGAAMSTKQLARTVMDGRMVQFRQPGLDDVEGYLCGMDDFHWMVIDGDGSIHLVHKSTPRITLLECSYDDEPNRDRLEDIVGPFRRSDLVQSALGRPSVSASKED